MSLLAIIGALIAAVAALFGGMAGKSIGKSSGRREGAQQANQQHEVIQAQESVKAVQERAHVEAEVAGNSDAELDARLRKHNRAD